MKVSIAMVTYQHERFLAEAIESVLAQRTTFDWELVIGEDCSPDRTRAIAQEYATRYPDRIRLELAERNQGLTYNLARTIGACRGEYVAWLEGDDFWTSPEKLQRQADYLDANRDCAWCFTRATVVDQEGHELPTASPVRVEKPKYTLEDYLGRLFQPRALTVMFRHRLFPAFPAWYYGLPTGDLPLHVLNAEHGDIGFIDEVMAAYRIHPGGVWSLGVDPTTWQQAPPEQLQPLIRRVEATIDLYEKVRTHLGSRGRPVLNAQINSMARWLSNLQARAGNEVGMRASLWRSLRAQPWSAQNLPSVRQLVNSYLPAPLQRPRAATPPPASLP